MEEENKYKVVFVGSSGVGKTNIIGRLLGKDFIEDTKSNHGGLFHIKTLEIEGNSFITEIWELDGDKKYRSLSKFFIKGTKGAFVVYDIKDKNSFNDIDEWMKILRYNEDIEIPIIIIGNKEDEYEEEQITYEQGELKAKEYGAYFTVTSAKDNVRGINEAFEFLMKRVLKNELEEIRKNNLKRRMMEESSYNENEKTKKLKEELNHYKSEYDDLKKVYNLLKQKYDKLKDENDKLNIELNKSKNIISNLEDKTKKNLNAINNLKNINLQKEDEINNLKLKIKNIDTFNKTSFNKDEILYVHFISSDQNINCPIKCLNTDTFAEVEERLYQKYQEFRETNNKFVSKGKVIMRYKKIIENNINDGDEVELIKFEQI